MIGLPGGTELVIILLIILLLFGGKKLPELMGGLGKGIRSFKKGVSPPDSDKLIPDIERAADATDETNEKGHKEASQ
ncbi:MAG: Sec-independent protein translocase subunit TatA/TatB [Planctomycetota bacterium]|jgi:sec-independent protein translocase protein TatA